MGENDPSRFLLVSTLLCTLACVTATLTPIIVDTSGAFAGSIVSSGLFGVVFAARNVQLLRETGSPSLPPAVLTTAFGGWFMFAPLLYPDVGLLPTASTQLAGTVVATFGLYVVVAGLTGE